MTGEIFFPENTQLSEIDELISLNVGPDGE